MHTSNRAGTLNTGSGKITLNQDGTIKLEGSYHDDLDPKYQSIIRDSTYKRVFAGGYGGYAALRSDDSLVISGYQTSSSTTPKEIRDKLLSSKVVDVQFNYGAGGAMLDNDEIVTWGHESYRHELRDRLRN